jgi:hypothetical protein
LRAGWPVFALVPLGHAPGPPENANDCWNGAVVSNNKSKAAVPTLAKDMVVRVQTVVGRLVRIINWTFVKYCHGRNLW